MATRAAIVLYNERFQAGICLTTMICPWKTLSDYEWWRFCHHLWQRTSTTYTQRAMLPISLRSNTGHYQTGQNVTTEASLVPASPKVKMCWSHIRINTTINSHHQLPYEVNYIKYRLCDAYTTPHSFCLKCPLTSQDLFSSPVPVNYTKWCIRHWFYQSTVVASNPIITCLLVQ